MRCRKLGQRGHQWILVDLGWKRFLGKGVREEVGVVGVT